MWCNTVLWLNLDPQVTPPPRQLQRKFAPAWVLPLLFSLRGSWISWACLNMPRDTARGWRQKKKKRKQEKPESMRDREAEGVRSSQRKQKEWLDWESKREFHAEADRHVWCLKKDKNRKGREKCDFNLETEDDTGRVRYSVIKCVINVVSLTHPVCFFLISAGTAP